MQPIVQMRDVWTGADLDALDTQDWRRFEILDGSLVVSPSPGREHELASAMVRSALQAVLPSELLVIGPMSVQVDRSYLIPDLVVVARALLRGGDPLAPSEVALVIEVVSPGSVTMDRITKPARYAAAGIGYYWRVETDPVSITAYELPAGADTYREVGTWGTGETARIERPFPVMIDVSSLAP